MWSAKKKVRLKGGLEGSGLWNAVAKCNSPTGVFNTERVKGISSAVLWTMNGSECLQSG